MNKIESIKETLKLFVKENAYIGDSYFDESTLLFKEGIFDSMGFVKLLTFLEEKFEIIPNDADLIEENFESINAISSFLEKRIKESYD
jgi:acyl carrier protein